VLVATETSHPALKVLKNSFTTSTVISNIHQQPFEFSRGQTERHADRQTDKQTSITTANLGGDKNVKNARKSVNCTFVSKCYFVHMCEGLGFGVFLLVVLMLL